MFSSTLFLLSAASSLALATTSSSGCGGDNDTPYKLNKLYEESIDSNGTTRSYYINLPENYDGDTAAPLILSFHGYGGSAIGQVSTDQFTNKTWNPDYVVIYPESDGVSSSSNRPPKTPQFYCVSGGHEWRRMCANKTKKTQAWQVAPYSDHGVNDLLFTSNLLKNLTSTLCIDTSRIYCSGKSIGGGFCNMLACDSTLSSSFAAIAPVSGAFYTTPANETWNSTCHASHPMPVLEFHGDADTVIPYDGGENNGIDLPTIPDWAKEWAAFDGCSDSTSVDAKYLNDSAVLHASYSCGTDAEEGAIVQHYYIDDLGHKWPTEGWNAENDGKGTYIDASPIILEFFGNWTLDDTAGGTTETGTGGSATSTTGTSSATGTGATASATATGTKSGGAGMVTAVPVGVVGAIALGALLL